MIERPSPGSIPDAPGSYQFLDADGRVIYVGKAKSLRSRVMSYFGTTGSLLPKTAQMVAQAERVEWVQVATEVEALLLEYSLIKTYRPRFNVRLIDDKSYPWLAVSLSEQWPGAYVTRGKVRRGTRYFGPYTNVKAVRDTLSLLVRTFPVRTCSNSKLVRHTRMGTPCLLYHIERCSGPCVGAVDSERYAGYLKGLMSFLSGDTRAVVRGLESEMKAAADRLEFERAARLRDSLQAIEKISEEQMVFAGNNENIDVVGVACEEFESAVFVLHVRRGRIVGRRSLIVEMREDAWTERDVVGKALERLYAEDADRIVTSVEGANAPSEVIVPCLPDDVDLYRALISRVALAGGAVTLPAAGSPVVPSPTASATGVTHPGMGVRPVAYMGARPHNVAIRVPSRGRKRALLERARENATHQLAQHKLKRSQDPATMARALEELQQWLGMDRVPLRIECYDTSHLQGTSYVASMVVLEDGIPKTSEYRRFRLRDVPSNNDFAAMEEVLRRRLGRLLEERRPGVIGAGDADADGSAAGAADDDGATRVASANLVAHAGITGGCHGVQSSRVGTRREETCSEGDIPAIKGARKFSYPPHLLLLDGGKGQLGVGLKVLEEFGLAGEIKVAALAKRLEEVFVAGQADPVPIPRGSETLFLLQRARDESHRFAVSYHRKLRGKAMIEGVLDGVPGLGPKRKARLLSEVGTLEVLRGMGSEALESMEWLPKDVGMRIYEALHTPGGRQSAGRYSGGQR